MSSVKPVLLNVSNIPWVPKQLKRNQAIFTSLLQGGVFERGVYVNPPRVSHASTLHGRAPQVAVQDISGVPDGATVVDVHFTLPFTWRRPVLQWSARRLAAQLSKGVLEGRPYVLWMNSLHQMSIALGGALAGGATRRVFDSSDDFTAWEEGDDRVAVVDGLRTVLGYVDTVVCMNDAVADSIRHPSRLVFENCTDFESFQRVPADLSLPPWIPKPAGTRIVGFTGGLNQGRVDFLLLEKLFLRFPDVRFLFAGYTNTASVDAFLARFPNVTFVGLVPYDRLPALIRAFDVAIVPHLDNDYTRGNDLLKVLDYFACGVPVVTTDSSNVRKYAGACAIASSHDEFIGFVSGLLDGRFAHDPEPGRRIASSRTWSLRVPELARQVLPELVASRDLVGSR